MYSHIEEKMKKTLASLDNQLAEIRAGRANPKILDRIMVSYYGVPTPINQVANIMVPEARMITIQPWDASLLKEIEKEIQKADLGINPTNDGKNIRLVFPELTEERRKSLVKLLKIIKLLSEVSEEMVLKNSKQNKKIAKSQKMI